MKDIILKILNYIAEHMGPYDNCENCSHQDPDDEKNYLCYECDDSLCHWKKKK